jgi:hypothetical protein
MNPRFLRLALLVMMGVPALRADPAALHLDDPGQLLPADPLWRKQMETRLGDYEAGSGIKLLVQFHAKSPAAEEDKVPGAYLHALASRLGVNRSGVLAVYFADEDEWRIWLGDELTPRFVGRPGTVEELTNSGAIHEVKEALLTALQATVAAAEPKTSPNARPEVGWHRRRSAEAMVDALIAQLGPGKK